jgi:hypothetical protein
LEEQKKETTTAEVSYLSQVECEIAVPNGILDTQVVEVRDEDGRNHALCVGKGEMLEKGDKKYLPIGLVSIDRKGKRALVELPEEAGSGTSRIWVPFTRFRRQEPFAGRQ